MADTNDPNTHHYSTAASIIILIILILLLLLLVYIGYQLYLRLRARRLGLAPPSLNPFHDSNRVPSRNYPASSGGALGWIKTKINGLRNTRSAGGAYEGSSGGARRGQGRRGFGALDPDEAWDARVGNEADEYGGGAGAGGYYEEQELGLTSHGYGPAGGLEEIPSMDRGRGRRELDERYDEEMGGRGARANPFGDQAERSDLRGVSPRPHQEPALGGSKVKKGKGSAEGERKSMFTENV